MYMDYNVARSVLQTVYNDTPIPVHTSSFSLTHADSPTHCAVIVGTYTTASLCVTVDAPVGASCRAPSYQVQSVSMCCVAFYSAAPLLLLHHCSCSYHGN